MAHADRIVQPADADDRLQGLGLPSRVTLLSAVRSGAAAFLDCPLYAPRTAPGLLMHIHTVVALRAMLLPDGWAPDCDRNQEPTISPDHRIRLIVMSGDDLTGSDGPAPLSRHARGALGARTILRNQLALDLFGDSDAVASSGCYSDNLTWALLHHVDVHARVVRSEVSLPANLGEDGRVDGWRERILLGDVDFGEGGALRQSPTRPSGDIDVEVTRRSVG